jgi:hypothetical protein
VRLTRAHGAVVVGALAVTAVLLGFAYDHRVTSSPGPVLVVRSGAFDASASSPPARGVRAHDEQEERAMALAGASMSPADRHRILETLDFVRTRIEARLSPLGNDLEDGDPLDELRSVLKPYLPTLTAARELERGSWQSADLAVRIAPSCAAAAVAAGESCISLWDTQDGPPALGRRARFLAWAAARAVVVDLGNRARAEECASALRLRTRLASSTLALVLLADDLAMRPTPDRAEIQEAARRLSLALASGSSSRDPTEKEELAALADARVAMRGSSWLTVPTTAVVVVPRLSAIADVAGLTKEIEAAAGPGARWIHAPTVGVH